MKPPEPLSREDKTYKRKQQRHAKVATQIKTQEKFLKYCKKYQIEPFYLEQAFKNTS